MDIESYSSFFMPTLLFLMDLKKPTNMEQQSSLSYITILVLWKDSPGQLGNFVKKLFSWLDTLLLSN